MASWYLAARYSRYPEMQEYRAQLEAAGHTVTSRWINGNHRVPDDMMKSDANPEYVATRGEFAIDDIADVITADHLILFGEDPRTATRGGRFVEFGFALATGKGLFLVGERENVFAALPRVQVYPTWDEFYNSIIGEKVR